jgi:hypothetical protein
MTDEPGTRISVDTSLLGLSLLAQAIGAAPTEVIDLTAQEYPLQTRYLSLLSASAAVVRVLARELDTTPEMVIQRLREELVAAAAVQ